MNESGCLFCRIARGELNANRVLETDDVVAFRDINPQAPVHVLVVPRRHIGSLNDLDSGHADLLGKLHVAAKEIAEREQLADNGWRLVVNVGADAGQTVPHLHLHLLGGRHLGWPPG
jgi:histidine triad (HIT) family protein